MAIRVYKYHLEIKPDTEVGIVSAILPVVCEFLKVGFQDRQLYLWALVESEARPDCAVRFLVLGTGWNKPEASPLKTWQHFDTIFDGPFVWHVFQELDTLPDPEER